LLVTLIFITGITRTYTVSISGTGTVTGTIFQKVQVVNSGQGCITKGSIGDTISIGNVVLLNQQTCETISNNVIPISVSVNKEGTPGLSQNNLGS
jgi:hypothetical protein